jgi:adenine-specific DNA methylase
MSPLWRQARAWLLPALQPQDGDEASLLAELASGRAQLWLAPGAAVVTELCREGETLSAHVWLAGGRLEAVMALRPGIEAWARGCGCAALTLQGRPGWSRLLRAHGYVAWGDELRRSL